MVKLPNWDGVVKEVNEQNFSSEVLDEKNKLVLVDFWSPSCTPCLRMIPTIESITIKYSTKIKVVKVNVEDSPTLPSRYRIGSIPNLLMFKDGEVCQQIIGTTDEKKIERLINASL